MTLSVAQVRIPERYMREMDKLVARGFYTNRSEVMRDAIRRLVLEKQVGSMPDTGDSVNEVREIRKKLSKQKINLDEINKL